MKFFRSVVVCFLLAISRGLLVTGTPDGEKKPSAKPSTHRGKKSARAPPRPLLPTTSVGVPAAAAAPQDSTPAVDPSQNGPRGFLANWWASDIPTFCHETERDYSGEELSDGFKNAWKALRPRVGQTLTRPDGGGNNQMLELLRFTCDQEQFEHIAEDALDDVVKARMAKAKKAMEKALSQKKDEYIAKMRYDEDFLPEDIEKGWEPLRAGLETAWTKHLDALAKQFKEDARRKWSPPSGAAAGAAALAAAVTKHVSDDDEDDEDDDDYSGGEGSGEGDGSQGRKRRRSPRVTSNKKQKGDGAGKDQTK